MENEILPTSRKLHCYEMLSLQYLQENDIALWKELCHYLIGTPVTSRKKINRTSENNSGCHEGCDIQVILEEY